MSPFMLQARWRKQTDVNMLGWQTNCLSRQSSWQQAIYEFTRCGRKRFTENRPSYQSVFQSNAFGIFLLALSAVVLGCQQGHYDTQSIPSQYLAQPTVDVSSLDLSPLGLPGAESDRIRIGDSVEVVVATGNNQGKPQTWLLRVEQNGSVDVPLVGLVNVNGLDPQEAQAAIRDASIQRGIFRRPSVAVNFHQRRTNRVIITGAVNEPGVYEIPIAGSSLLDAITIAGGLSEDADMLVEVRQTRDVSPAIEVPNHHDQDARVVGASFEGRDELGNIRNGKESLFVQQINLVTAAAGQPIPKIKLNDGAIVTIKRRPIRVVRVIGLVKKPRQIELSPNKDIRLLDAIAEAGGLTTSIANTVLIIRQLPGSFQPIVVKASIRDAKSDGAANLLLTDGDVVSIEETPITFVVGTVLNFVRLGLTTPIL